MAENSDVQISIGWSGEQEFLSTAEQISSKATTLARALQGVGSARVNQVFGPDAVQGISTVEGRLKSVDEIRRGFSQNKIELFAEADRQRILQIGTAFSSVKGQAEDLNRVAGRLTLFDEIERGGPFVRSLGEQLFGAGSALKIVGASAKEATGSTQALSKAAQDAAAATERQGKASREYAAGTVGAIQKRIAELKEEQKTLGASGAALAANKMEIRGLEQALQKALSTSKEYSRGTLGYAQQRLADLKKEQQGLLLNSAALRQNQAEIRKIQTELDKALKGGSRFDLFKGLTQGAQGAQQAYKALTGDLSLIGKATSQIGETANKAFIGLATTALGAGVKVGAVASAFELVRSAAADAGTTSTKALGLVNVEVPNITQGFRNVLDAGRLAESGIRGFGETGKAAVAFVGGQVQSLGPVLAGLAAQINPAAAAFAAVGAAAGVAFKLLPERLNPAKRALGELGDQFSELQVKLSQKFDNGSVASYEQLLEKLRSGLRDAEIAGESYQRRLTRIIQVQAEFDASLNRAEARAAQDAFEQGFDRIDEKAGAVANTVKGWGVEIALARQALNSVAEGTDAWFDAASRLVAATKNQNELLENQKKLVAEIQAGLDTQADDRTLETYRDWSAEVARIRKELDAAVPGTEQQLKLAQDLVAAEKRRDEILRSSEALLKRLRSEQEGVTAEVRKAAEVSPVQVNPKAAAEIRGIVDSIQGWREEVARIDGLVRNAASGQSNLNQLVSDLAFAQRQVARLEEERNRRLEAAVALQKLLNGEVKALPAAGESLGSSRAPRDVSGAQFSQAADYARKLREEVERVPASLEEWRARITEIDNKLRSLPASAAQTRELIEEKTRAEIRYNQILSQQKRTYEEIQQQIRAQGRTQLALPAAGQSSFKALADLSGREFQRAVEFLRSLQQQPVSLERMKAELADVNRRIRQGVSDQAELNSLQTQAAVLAARIQNEEKKINDVIAQRRTQYEQLGRLKALPGAGQTNGRSGDLSGAEFSQAVAYLRRAREESQALQRSFERTEQQIAAARIRLEQFSQALKVDPGDSKADAGLRQTRIELDALLNRYRELGAQLGRLGSQKPLEAATRDTQEFSRAASSTVDRVRELEAFLERVGDKDSPGIRRAREELLRLREVYGDELPGALVLYSNAVKTESAKWGDIFRNAGREIVAADQAWKRTVEATFDGLTNRVAKVRQDFRTLVESFKQNPFGTTSKVLVGDLKAIGEGVLNLPRVLEAMGAAGQAAFRSVGTVALGAGVKVAGVVAAIEVVKTALSNIAGFKSYNPLDKLVGGLRETADLSTVVNASLKSLRETGSAALGVVGSGVDVVRAGFLGLSGSVKAVLGITGAIGALGVALSVLPEKIGGFVNPLKNGLQGLTEAYSKFAANATRNLRFDSIEAGQAQLRQLRVGLDAVSLSSERFQRRFATLFTAEFFQNALRSRAELRATQRAVEELVDISQKDAGPVAPTVAGYEAEIGRLQSLARNARAGSESYREILIEILRYEGLLSAEKAEQNRIQQELVSNLGKATPVDNTEQGSLAALNKQLSEAREALQKMRSDAAGYQQAAEAVVAVEKQLTAEKQAQETLLTQLRNLAQPDENSLAGLQKQLQEQQAAAAKLNAFDEGQREIQSQILSLETRITEQKQEQARLRRELAGTTAGPAANSEAALGQQLQEQRAELRNLEAGTDAYRAKLLEVFETESRITEQKRIQTRLAEELQGPDNSVSGLSASLEKARAAAAGLEGDTDDYRAAIQKIIDLQQRLNEAKAVEAKRNEQILRDIEAQQQALGLVMTRAEAAQRLYDELFGAQAAGPARLALPPARSSTPLASEEQVRLNNQEVERRNTLLKEQAAELQRTVEKEERLARVEAELAEGTRLYNIVALDSRQAIRAKVTEQQKLLETLSMTSTRYFEVRERVEELTRSLREPVPESSYEGLSRRLRDIAEDIRRVDLSSASGRDKVRALFAELRSLEKNQLDLDVELKFDDGSLGKLQAELARLERGKVDATAESFGGLSLRILEARRSIEAFGAELGSLQQVRADLNFAQAAQQLFAPGSEAYERYKAQAAEAQRALDGLSDSTGKTAKATKEAEEAVAGSTRALQSSLQELQKQRDGVERNSEEWRQLGVQIREVQQQLREPLPAQSLEGYARAISDLNEELRRVDGSTEEGRASLRALFAQVQELTSQQKAVPLFSWNDQEARQALDSTSKLQAAVQSLESQLQGTKDAAAFRQLRFDILDARYALDSFGAADGSIQKLQATANRLRGTLGLIGGDDQNRKAYLTELKAIEEQIKDLNELADQTQQETQQVSATERQAAANSRKAYQERIAELEKERSLVEINGQEYRQLGQQIAQLKLAQTGAEAGSSTALQAQLGYLKELRGLLQIGSAGWRQLGQAIRDAQAQLRESEDGSVADLRQELQKVQALLTNMNPQGLAETGATLEQLTQRASQLRKQLAEAEAAIAGTSGTSKGLEAQLQKNRALQQETKGQEELNGLRREELTLQLRLARLQGGVGSDARLNATIAAYEKYLKTLDETDSRYQRLSKRLAELQARRKQAQPSGADAADEAGSINALEKQVQVIRQKLQAINAESAEVKELRREYLRLSEALEGAQRKTGLNQLGGTLRRQILEGVSLGLQGATGPLQVFGSTVGAIGGAIAGAPFWGALLGQDLGQRADRFAQESITAFREFEDQVKKLGVIAGLTTADTDALAERIKSLALLTGESSSELAKLATELARAGIGGKDLEAILSTAVKAAAATGEDVKGVGDALRQAAQVFGVSGDAILKTGDQLTLIANRTSTGITDLAVSLSKVGPIAQASGLSLIDVASVLGVLRNTGLEASSAGTGLAEFLNRLKVASAGLVSQYGGLVRGNKRAIDALRELDVAIRNPEGNLRSLGEIVEAFRVKLGQLRTEDKDILVRALGGEQGQKILFALVNQSQNLNELIKDVNGNADGALDEFLSDTESALREAKRVNEQWEQLKQNVGELAAGPTSAFGKLSRAIADNFGEAAQDLADAQKKAAAEDERRLYLNATWLQQFKKAFAIGPFAGNVKANPYDVKIDPQTFKALAELERLTNGAIKRKEVLGNAFERFADDQDVSKIRQFVLEEAQLLEYKQQQLRLEQLIADIRNRNFAKEEANKQREKKDAKDLATLLEEARSREAKRDATEAISKKILETRNKELAESYARIGFKAANAGQSVEDFINSGRNAGLKPEVIEQIKAYLQANKDVEKSEQAKAAAAREAAEAQRIANMNAANAIIVLLPQYQALLDAQKTRKLNAKELARLAELEKQLDAARARATSELANSKKLLNDEYAKQLKLAKELAPGFNLEVQLQLEKERLGIATQYNDILSQRVNAQQGLLRSQQTLTDAVFKAEMAQLEGYGLAQNDEALLQRRFALQQEYFRTKAAQLLKEQELERELLRIKAQRIELDAKQAANDNEIKKLETVQELNKKKAELDDANLKRDDKKQEQLGKEIQALDAKLLIIDETGQLLERRAATNREILGLERESLANTQRAAQLNLQTESRQALAQMARADGIKETTASLRELQDTARGFNAFGGAIDQSDSLTRSLGGVASAADGISSAMVLINERGRVLTDLGSDARAASGDLADITAEFNAARRQGLSFNEALDAAVGKFRGLNRSTDRTGIEVEQAGRNVDGAAKKLEQLPKKAEAIPQAFEKITTSINEAAKALKEFDSTLKSVQSNTGIELRFRIPEIQGLVAVNKGLESSLRGFRVEVGTKLNKTNRLLSQIAAKTGQSICCGCSGGGGSSRPAPAPSNSGGGSNGVYFANQLASLI